MFVIAINRNFCLVILRLSVRKGVKILSLHSKNQCKNTMLPKHVIISVAIFGVFSLTCGVDQITFPRLKTSKPALGTPTAVSIKSLNELTRKAEAFSLELLQYMSRGPKTYYTDFILSPFSIWTLLVLLTEGAGGNTFTQLETVLRLPPDLTNLRLLYKSLVTEFQINSTDIELQANQVIFSDQNRPIDIGFQYKLENIYEADYLPVNFYDMIETHEKINNYVNEKTHGRFKQIVALSDLSQAQMILISAIFFKGTWKFPFNAYDTIKLPFHDENGNVVSEVNMMTRSGGAKFTNIPELKADVLEFEYSNDNRLSLVALLPEKKTQLIKVIDNLRTFGISRLMDRLAKFEALDEPDFEIYLPRFTIESNYELNDVLSNMGLSDVFDIHLANFTKISHHPVHISKFVHKATIEVNEVGTVAASVSGATLSFTIALPQIKLDRPFLFLIVEKHSNTLAFCGQVRNPQKV